jgi:diguanylate cyclase (GGDEF)-like protein/PAS domain S-box-containing protein
LPFLKTEPATPERGRTGGDILQRILDDVARAAATQAGYRRIVVTLYDCPLTDGPGQQTHVAKYACQGLDPRDEEMLHGLVVKREPVRADKYALEYRLGQSYYIPERGNGQILLARIKSRRRFISQDGWSSGDLLLVPIRLDGEVLGQISVDDPRDGACPTLESLNGLEDLASVAGVALSDARSLEALSEQHRLFHSVTERSIAGVAIVQADRFWYINNSLVQMLGYSREALLAMTPWSQVIHPDERVAAVGQADLEVEGSFEARAVRSNGDSIWMRWMRRPIEYAGQTATLFHLVDITERIRAERFLKERALHDSLTGLYNRFYFDETICTELKRSQRYSRPFTLLMTDLAGFKAVNDRLGHQKGDEVLREIARIVQEQIRESDWAIRYGGDEFLVVLPETGRRIEPLVQRLRGAVEAWRREYGVDLSLGIDIGWATWTPGSNQSIDDLLRLADANMYEVKATRGDGKGPVAGR